MDLLDNVLLEDLNEEQQEVAELIGFNTYISLVRVMGGSYIYVPKADRLCINARNKVIRNEFVGNYKRIAIKYGITQTQVRNIINEE